MAKRKRRRKHLGSTASGCIAAGLKGKGRLRKGFRWAKGRKGCAIKAKG